MPPRISRSLLKPAPRASGEPVRTRKAEKPGSPPEAIDYGNLGNFIGYELRRAQMRLYDDFFRTTKGTGISPALYGALVLVECNPGVQQGHLGKALGVARSGAMTMVDRLQSLELVVRRPSPHDRRAYGLHLTAKGSRLAAELHRRIAAHDRRMGEKMTEDERRQLMLLLRRI